MTESSIENEEVPRVSLKRKTGTWSYNVGQW